MRRRHLFLEKLFNSPLDAASSDRTRAGQGREPRPFRDRPLCPSEAATCPCGLILTGKGLWGAPEEGLIREGTVVSRVLSPQPLRQGLLKNPICSPAIHRIRQSEPHRRTSLQMKRSEERGGATKVRPCNAWPSFLPGERLLGGVRECEIRRNGVGRSMSFNEKWKIEQKSFRFPDFDVKILHLPVFEVDTPWKQT